MAKEKVVKAKDEEVKVAKEKVEGEEDEVKEEDEAAKTNELPGVPNKLPPRFEGEGKGRLGIFFVAEVEGGNALYNENGIRVSQVCTGPEAAYLAKAATRNNAIRRANRTPQDRV